MRHMRIIFALKIAWVSTVSLSALLLVPGPASGADIFVEWKVGLGLTPAEWLDSNINEGQTKEIDESGNTSSLINNVYRNTWFRGEKRLETGNGFYLNAMTTQPPISNGVDLTVSGWVDYKPRGTNPTTAVAANTVTSFFIGRKSEDASGIYPADRCLSAFTGYLPSCAPTGSYSLVGVPQNPDGLIADPASHVAVVGNFLQISHVPVVEPCTLLVTIGASNGYGSGTSLVTVNITPCVLVVSVVTDGTPANAGAAGQAEGWNGVKLVLLTNDEAENRKGSSKILKC